MKIYKLMPLSVCATNCFIVETENKNALLIDAPDDAEYILSKLEQYELTLKKILLTHGHCDHIAAAEDLREKTGAEVYIHENDAAMLKGSPENLAMYIIGQQCRQVKAFIPVKNGDKITLDELELEVMHTPGHTKGSVCYVCENTIFSGDTLFCGSVGRIDFPGGSRAEQRNSLKLLKELKGDYHLLSGHGEDSTLDFERKTNMYLQVD